MQERTSLKAVIQGKCPACRVGDIFAAPVRKISKFHIMNETCPHCGVRLEPEPGFYQGAMYVSYGFTVMVMVIISILLYHFFGNPSEWTYIFIIIAALILVVPWNYRYSRIIYLYLFGGLKFRGKK